MGALKLPLVSVIMPSYNAEKYIGEAITSILQQTYSNFELIIIDDASTDGTRDVLSGITDKRCQVYLNEKNAGIAETRNQALRMARGKYIAFMDDDDIALPQRLELEVAFLEDADQIGIVGGNIKIFNQNTDRISFAKEIWHNPKLIRAAYLFQSVMYNSTVLMRKSLIDQYGIYFQDDCFGMEDFMFYMQYSKLTLFTNLDEIFLMYRQHDSSETQQVRQNKMFQRMEKYAQIQKMSLQQEGFVFSAAELLNLSRLLRENLGLVQPQEIVELIVLFRSIHLQAKLLQLRYLPELDFYCRWRLAQTVRNCKNVLDYDMKLSLARNIYD